MAAFFVLILAIGGLSSFLAWSILSSTQEILGQSHHIVVTETIHATIHHLIREVDRAIIEGSLDRQFHMADLTTRAGSTTAAFLEEHLHEEEPFAEKEAEVADIRTIQKLYHDLDAAANRTIARLAAKARARLDDLQVPDAVAHRLPVLTQHLNDIHQAKIRRLITKGITRMKVILVGAACMIAGMILFSRTVALPLRRLASATLDIAAGDFGKRVPIGSRDEIGQPSYPETASATPQEVVEVPLSVSGRTRKQQWARLIKQVYEADPLLCPRCGGGMRILAFIEPACADTADRQPEVIDLPVPGTCLRAETHRQADREDPHPSPCLCREQTGASGRPERTARRRGTRCCFLCNGSSPHSAAA